MTTTIDRSLDQALQRYGDDLYRLAVLLALDTSKASTALERAARLATTRGVFDERALVEALVAALPPERPAPRRLPGWARTALPMDERLLAALLALPRPQRLALGLGVLRSFEALNGEQLTPAPEQASASGLITRESLAADRREALLTLAPAAYPGHRLPPMVGEAVPEACRPARTALLNGDAALLDEPAVRGHLALCAECRAAAAAWRTIGTRVEEVLRAVLREVRVPPGLEGQLLAAASAKRGGLLQRAWMWRALVPAAVLLAIVAVVLPRPTELTPPALTAAASPVELVRQARDRLYTLPSGDGIWQARYAMRWVFADASYAMLEGSLWLDGEQRRHRIQLVHQDGGGPFEIQVGDGERRLWYSVDSRYATSLNPQIAGRWPGRVQLEVPADEQERMLAARIASGAWDLPDAYLRQAEEADELQSWGRSTAEDGAELAVVSFRGTSPLAQPAGAERSDPQVTVLLSLGVADGTLYEVRELIGSEEGEQAGRTVWRYLGGEWLERSPSAEAVFDVRRTLPRASSFAILPAGAVAPELPTVPAETLRSPAQAVVNGSFLPLLAPSEMPPGTERAALLLESGDIRPTILYFGRGRLLTISTLPPGDPLGRMPPSTRATEGWVLSDDAPIASAAIRMQPGPARRYEAIMASGGQEHDETYLARISAQGFGYEELTRLLRTIAPLNIDSVRRQAPLFIGREGQDPAALDALLGALAEPPPPPEGSVRRTIARVYSRQLAGADALADPYHLPPYGGRPDTMQVETWTRAARTVGEGAEGQPLVERATLMRGRGGVIFDRTYAGPRGSWTYDAARGEAFEFGDSVEYPSTADGVRYALVQMLACGGGEMSRQGGERAVVLTELDWRRESCVLPHYTGFYELQSRLLLIQQNGGVNVTYVTGLSTGAMDGRPYLADVTGDRLTIVVSLTDEGRLARYEVYAGGTRSPRETLVERWELVSDEVLPAERVPAGVFVAQSPAAFVKWRFGAADAAPVELVSLDITQARGILGGAVYALPDEPRGGSGARPAAELTDISVSQRDPDVAYGSFLAYPDPFQGALYHGVALRFSLTFSDAGGAVSEVFVYQGRAERFGAYLRARARWMASESTRLNLGGESVDGWLVTTLDGRRWAIAERGGLLVVVPADTPAQLDLMGRLERL
jgi:hypothetical protein